MFFHRKNMQVTSGVLSQCICTVFFCCSIALTSCLHCTPLRLHTVSHMSSGAACPATMDALAVLEAVGCTRIISWTEAQMQFAVLVQALSSRADLALHSVRLSQLAQHRWRPGLAVIPTKEHLHRWSADDAIQTLVQGCLANPLNPLRQKVQLFLAESYVAEVVYRFNQTGLLVPSSRVLQLYLRALQWLPLSSASSVFADRLRDAQFAKRWSRNFRQRWGLEWSGELAPHSICQRDISQRAAIFLRWVRHVLQDRLCGKPAVIVNMDETMLSNIKPWKKGIGFKRAGGQSRPEGIIHREAALSRTSLIASVCSAARVQPLLPQIRLPRATARGFPSKVQQAAYARASAPQVALHGGSGWNTAVTMKWYLKLLAAAVAKGAPGHAVVLVMDCCPVHLSRDVLAAAHRRGIQVIILPARLTWLMQPLDTHVFAQLKRSIRNAEYDWKANRNDSRMPAARRIEVHGEAIRQVLVDGAWSLTMVRAGMTGASENLRRSLALAVESEELSPRAPSVEELAPYLGKSLEQATSLRRLLLPALASERPANVAAAAAASAAPAAEASAARGPCRSAGPVVILSLRPLPPKPAGAAPGRNAWLPPAVRRVQTRSMSAAAASAAASTAEAVTGAPPAQRRRRR